MTLELCWAELRGKMLTLAGMISNIMQNLDQSLQPSKSLNTAKYIRVKA